MKEKATWDASEKWYHECVGEKGHYYHQKNILANGLRLLNLKPQESLLDLGCGQGVLERQLPKDVHYVGVDQSKALIAHAKKESKNQFIVADVCETIPLDKKDFDAACFILSLQNMEEGHLAIKTASSHLKPQGRLLIVLNHPCFRIPRQSQWGVDESAKIQYRRMNTYMSSHKIPIQTNPSKSEKSAITHSFHNPLSTYMTWLAKNHFTITAMEEWCSDKSSEGSHARMENRARKEFPLFLALLCCHYK